jgi:hypothetical protein
MEERIKRFTEIMKPKDYICRVYVTRGIGVGGSDQAPTTYLRLSLAGVVKSLKSTTLRKDTCNPEYYVCQDLVCKIPGTAMLHVDVMSDETFGDDEIIGTTKIDMEDRFFSKKWNLINIDPDKTGNKRSTFIQKYIFFD